MREIIVNRLRSLFSKPNNKPIYKLDYGVDGHQYNVQALLMNLFVLNDEEIIDFYTWCVVRCYEGNIRK